MVICKLTVVPLTVGSPERVRSDPVIVVKAPVVAEAAPTVTPSIEPLSIFILVQTVGVVPALILEANLLPSIVPAPAVKAVEPTV